MLAHRGPDGEGVHASGPVALAHRRLAIIDLSGHGSQPMSNEDGAHWLVFNGEIYNYLELRPSLIARGHRFHSNTDSEVILHEYEERGPACTERFNGMWAFALWDSRRQELFLSRDRLGEKPLYYFCDASRLIFASEIKAILALRPDLARPNAAEMVRFLGVGFMEMNHETIFQGIYQVPAGHTLQVSADGRMRMLRYWAPPDVEEEDRISPRQAAATLLEPLEDSVRLRLRSDVPVGTCLSGGLDSAAVVDIESRLLRGFPIYTFSWIHEENGFSEEPFVKAVTEAYPTLPHRIHPSADFHEVLPRILWHQEFPLIAPGVYAQWCVMSLARGKVKVLLDGQGADELLGGYAYFYADHLAELLAGSWNPARIVDLAAALLRMLRRIPADEVARQARDGLRRVLRFPREAGFAGGWYTDYLVPELLPSLSTHLEARPASRRRLLANALLEDLTLFSLPRMLHYEDRNSMAHGIEARTPFLDYRLVEFCLRLPGRVRVQRGVTKAPLRRAMRGRLPDLVSRRREKVGFSEPAAGWMRGPGYEWMSDILLSDRIRNRGIFRMDRISRILEEHRRGAIWTHPLYRALTLEMWFRLFVDGEGGALFPPPRSASQAAP